MSDLEKQNFKDLLGKCSGLTEETYIELRNLLINSYNKNPTEYLTITSCRRIIAIDVSTIIKIHSFLEKWGLINFESKNENRRNTGNFLQEAARQFNDSFIENFKLSSETNEQNNNGIEETSMHSSNVQVSEIDTNKSIGFVQNFFKTMENNEDYEILQKESTDEHFKTWTKEEVEKLLEAVETHKQNWEVVAFHVGPKKTAEQCIIKFMDLFASNLSNDANTQIIDSTTEYNYKLEKNELLLERLSYRLKKLTSCLSALLPPQILKKLLSKNVKYLKNLKQQHSEDETLLNKNKFLFIVCSSLATLHINLRELRYSKVEDLNRNLTKLLSYQVLKYKTRFDEIETLKETFVKIINKLEYRNSLLSNEGAIIFKEKEQLFRNIDKFRKLVGQNASISNNICDNLCENDQEKTFTLTNDFNQNIQPNKQQSASRNPEFELFVDKVKESPQNAINHSEFLRNQQGQGNTNNHQVQTNPAVICQNSYNNQVFGGNSTKTLGFNDNDILSNSINSINQLLQQQTSLNVPTGANMADFNQNEKMILHKQNTINNNIVQNINMMTTAATAQTMDKSVSNDQSSGGDSYAPKVLSNMKVNLMVQDGKTFHQNAPFFQTSEAQTNYSQIAGINHLVNTMNVAKEFNQFNTLQPNFQNNIQPYNDYSGEMKQYNEGEYGISAHDLTKMQLNQKNERSIPQDNKNKNYNS